MVTRTPTNRPTHMSIARIAPGDGATGWARRGKLFARVSNIHLPEPRHHSEIAYGPIGDENWNTGATSIGSDFTFDLEDALDAPEGVGPVMLEFEAYETVTPAAKTRKFQVRGFIEVPGSGTYNRATTMPRTVTVKPKRLVIGGGDDYEGLALAAHGAAWSSNPPVCYLDAERGIYRTCDVGGTVVDHMLEIYRAHGVAIEQQNTG